MDRYFQKINKHEKKINFSKYLPVVASSLVILNLVSCTNHKQNFQSVTNINSSSQSSAISIEEFNKRLLSSLPEFEKYLPKLLPAIIELTKNGKEVSGYIIKKDEKFFLEVIQNPNDFFMTSVEEFLEGNFTKKEQFLSMYKEYESAIKKKTGIDYLMIQNLLNLLEFIETSKNKEFDAIEVSDSQGNNFIIKKEELSQVIETIHQVLQELHRFFRLSQLWVIDLNEIQRRTEIISRFHTHPFNDPSYMPSIDDIKNTLYMGPNVLFTQYKGQIRVYVIYDGKSYLLYEQRIN
ncbi:MAG: hypothetical protein QW076_02595 [Candidatus Anstonellales archaeon]